MGTAADGIETLRTGLVEPAIALGWQVAVTLTPNAGRWLRANGELDRLETLTGLPVRDTPRLPTEPRPHPVVDCYVVAPASANYIAKLATGIADNQALTQVSEALGTIGCPWWCSLGSTPRMSGTRRGSVTSRLCGRQT
ncbi:flavoprotein [Streptomyces sp. NPDC006539]|uniref:flavoprotein n=1 Tax=Streptomyces sp. NPDC006539 TaxID=3155352 RepID=UPI0033B17734